MTAPSIKEAAERLLRLKAARESFRGYVALMKPRWTIPAFHEKLIDILDKFEKGTLTRGDIYDNDPNPDQLIDRLLLTMPPRHSKTEYATKMFPAYCMARKPDRYIMSSSYNGELAKEFGRAARDYAQEQDTRLAFPELEIRKDSSAADEWRTTVGGAYFGIGLDGTTSGRPANILIIDDPIKSRKDADSVTNRNHVWNFYTSALAMRLQPEEDGTQPKQLVILTRWHPDDLAGRLMATEEWKNGEWGHVNFPAIKVLPDGTEEALWPERFPLDELKRRERLNPREFAALYMQSPYILGGNLFKSNWWRYYPNDLKPERFNPLIIAADTAFKKQDNNDPSVFLTAGLDRNGDIYIIDVMRQRLTYPELRQRAIQTNTLWRGKGLRGFYIEDKASGQSLIQDLRRETGISVIPYKTGGRDKVARANAVLPLIEGGRVFLPQSAPWLDDFMEETVSFPSGAHDDQVDALVMALDILSRISMSPDAFAAMPEGPSLAELAARDISLTKMFGQAKRWAGWGE